MNWNDFEAYTLNTSYADVEIVTQTFVAKADAVAVAREEVKWGDTVHATVTHEPTGEDVFDSPGDFEGLLGPRTNG